jgi:hypothetical protein
LVQKKAISDKQKQDIINKVKSKKAPVPPVKKPIV